jgi:hypothetical protein
MAKCSAMIQAAIAPWTCTLDEDHDGNHKNERYEWSQTETELLARRMVDLEERLEDAERRIELLRDTIGKTNRGPW